MSKKYKIIDYTDEYGSQMQFCKNKNEYIHQWYPFVEGYSKTFIRKVLNEYVDLHNGSLPNLCLEPFSGSGTTPLEFQKMGIDCYSFEVSPFMYNLSKTKLSTNYCLEEYYHYYSLLFNDINQIQPTYDLNIFFNDFKKMVEKKGVKRWNFDAEVMQAILSIKFAIERLENQNYEGLFNIALCAILLKVSNVYRNGKCLSYKPNWKEKRLSREDVISEYKDWLDTKILPDIVKLDHYKKSSKIKSNASKCIQGDCRKLIFSTLVDNSIDLIITSPPYLNSRDYTDTYMLELRVMGYTKNLREVQALREKTLRSHVQVQWKSNLEILNIPPLKRVLNELKKYEARFWNKGLLNMIIGYFNDLDLLFQGLYRKLTIGGMIYFNVANSAYYNVNIKVDEIVCYIAERNGLNVIEIRKARIIHPSAQQKSVKSLRESVIVIQKLS